MNGVDAFDCVDIPIHFFHSQINFDAHLKAVSEMTEIGETVERVDALIWETKTFQTLCDTDMERAEDVVATGESIPVADKNLLNFQLHFLLSFPGQQLVSVHGACPKEVVQPKCDELARVCDIVSERLTRRLETLMKNRDLMERVEKVSAITCCS